MSQDDNTPQGLWAPRSVEETLQIYRDWADSYDADVTGMGYATPARIAMALRMAGVNPAKPVLDFGCGTGLSGLALKATGFEQIDGTDISAEMLDRAKATGAYRHTWLGTPGNLGPVRPGDYPTIVACGVVSLGAAPAETLDMLVSALPDGGHLAFSYNDATLAAPDYMARLDAVASRPDIALIHQEHGPHLPARDMKSTVYIIQKT